MSRCVALKKDLERCPNHAERRSVFCRKHRWWWLITLFGSIVVITTIGANISQMFGATFTNPLIAKPTVSVQAISTPAYSSNNVRLIPIDGQNIVVHLNGQSLASSDVIPLNEIITVNFRIINNGISAITIEALVIGSRGPGVSCENMNVEKWSAPDNPFRTDRNITIEPGEEYEYSSSRAFYLAGSYFLEPIIQGSNGNWGGIQPFSCFNIVVVELQAPETETILDITISPTP